MLKFVMFLVLVVLFVDVVYNPLYSIISKNSAVMENKSSSGFLYDINVGTVYCAGFKETSCGIKLYLCSDENIYFCEQNVRQRKD